MPATAHQLPTWECLELLQDHGIGRLCLVDGGYPIAVPINYRLLTGDAGAHLVVRTLPDSMVGRYRGPCALEVDEIDLAHGRAWSVIARGSVQPAHRSHALPDPMPIVAGNRDRWMVIDVAVVSGRRFVLAEAADGCSVEWQLA
jgi:Pyridoxamine 5'-phosphate oxidase